MGMNRERYPRDWDEISWRIRYERAGGCCEWCSAVNGQPHPITGSRVVLTVAHWPDSNPMNCAEENLHALCQRCHNRLDAPMRQRHAAETRKRKRQERIIQSGQQSLWDDQRASEG